MRKQPEGKIIFSMGSRVKDKLSKGRIINSVGFDGYVGRIIHHD
ncbi:hypothetical protein [Marinifilum fragile]|nr:hypothetical protein [Marinifilum fragile]